MLRVNRMFADLGNLLEIRKHTVYIHVKSLLFEGKAFRYDGRTKQGRLG